MISAYKNGSTILEAQPYNQKINIYFGALDFLWKFTGLLTFISTLADPVLNLEHVMLKLAVSAN